MATILIVDNEKHCIESIIDLISRCNFEFEIITSAQTVKEAIYKTNSYKPDLIFLDIHLGNQTGFDFLSEIEKKDFDLIFTTAYEQYAVKAFEFSALDYLLKPINLEDFKRAINKFNNNVSRQYFENKMDVFLHNLKNDILNRKIVIPSQEGLEFLELHNIVRFQADGNYTHVFLKNGTKFTASKTLKYFEDMLSGSIFFRVHHSHMINLEHIKKYYKGRGGYIIMEDNTSVNVSVRKKESLLKFITDHY